MKTFTFENQWDAIKGRLQQRFAHLTDDDVALAEGRGEELLARLREKLGLSARDLNALLTELGDAAEGGYERAKAKVGEVADEVRARASAVAEDVKTKASSAADEVKAQAGVLYDQAQERARGFFKEGEEYVRHNPRHALLGALCAGFVAGLLVRR